MGYLVFSLCMFFAIFIFSRNVKFTLWVCVFSALFAVTLNVIAVLDPDATYGFFNDKTYLCIFTYTFNFSGLTLIVYYFGIESKLLKYGSLIGSYSIFLIFAVTFGKWNHDFWYTAVWFFVFSLIAFAIDFLAHTFTSEYKVVEG